MASLEDGKMSWIPAILFGSSEAQEPGVLVMSLCDL
jgi:hypothetical protein